MTVLALDLVARSEALSAWTENRQLRIARETKLTYSQFGYFIDPEDHLLLENSSADYSKGGVYLIGTSIIKFASTFSGTPAESAGPNP